MIGNRSFVPYVQDRGGAQQTASNEQLQTITAEDVEVPQQPAMTQGERMQRTR